MHRACIAALLLAVVGAGAGCAPSRTANYTPGAIPVTPARTYPFEVEWKSSRTRIDPATVKAYVMVDDVLYPMTRVPVAPNRWEAQVPIAEGRQHVPYKYKFEYPYPGLGRTQMNSEWSPEYRLTLPQQP